MSAYLTDKANIIISSTSTPSTAERNAQFAPKALKPTCDSIATESSGRADSGDMHIEWIYSRVRKIEIELAPDSVANISVILDKVTGRKYYITFWDTITNTEMTKYVYTSNSSSEWYSGVIYNGLVQGASFNAIEMGGEV